MLGLLQFMDPKPVKHIPYVNILKQTKKFSWTIS